MTKALPQPAPEIDRDAAPSFAAVLARHGLAPPARRRVRTLQVNVGRRCNQACHHCHVEAGPGRTETMDAATAERVLELLAAHPEIETLDLTGGAPELHPAFRPLVDGARRLDRRVVDRCNLTVLLEPGQEDTAAFLADREVEIVASLPCYERDNVERQRGRGVYEKSIEVLKRLNRLGYGRGGPRVLNLVFNPGGASLPPPQAALEVAYRWQLRERFGVEFDRLLTLANVPISRFAEHLERRGETAAYRALLVEHFNPETLPEVMCTRLLSVGYDGRLYDCDFNQMLGLPLGGRATTLRDCGDLADLAGRPIATGAHCLACTAGAGSSCSGALVSPAGEP